MPLSPLNEYIFRLINGLAGHSWALDSFVSILENNELAKGAVIGACFAAAWYSGTKHQERIKVRRLLLITITAAVMVLTATKLLSHTIFYPRPYMSSNTIYHLQNNELAKLDKIVFNIPLDEINQGLYSNYLDGRITVNHLGTFPSDNAGFFITIALGIILAYRTAGFIAMMWTLVFILGAKIFTGKHFPMDVAAGTAMAAAGFFSMKVSADYFLDRFFTAAARWTLKHQVFSSAVVFIIVFETASTLDHLDPIFSYIRVLAERIISF